MAMSQNDQQKPNQKHAPTSEPNKQHPPVHEVSPNDPFPVEPTGGPGKPGQAEK